MRLRETNGDSWDSGSLLGTHETHEIHRDFWGLMRIIETHKYSWESKRLMEAHETQKDYCGIMSRDPWDSGRIMETPETQEDYLGLRRLMGLVENSRDSWDFDYCGLMRIIDSLGLMRLRETNGYSWDSERLLGTHVNHWDCWELMRIMRLIETSGDSWNSWES